MGNMARATKEIKKKDLQSQLDTQAMSIFYIGRNVYGSITRLEAVISLLIEKGIFTEEEFTKMIEENKKELEETQEQEEKDTDIQKVIEESKSEGENKIEENI